MYALERRTYHGVEEQDEPLATVVSQLSLRELSVLDDGRLEVGGVLN